MQTLILIRGLPGSGKSTLADTLLNEDNLARNSEECRSEEVPILVHFEADMWFVNDGVYRFHAHLLPCAHRWCQAKTKKALDDGKSVIVSNTFTTIAEIAPYKKMAEELGVKFQVIECHGDFGSIHNVPEETIARMKARWQPYFLPELLS